MPKFIHKNMEEIYVEEKKAQVKQMMAIHLETFPIAKGGVESKSGLYKMKKYVIYLSVFDDYNLIACGIHVSLHFCSFGPRLFYFNLFVSLV